MPTFDLASIVTEHKQSPPRMIIHGPRGVGKTTFGVSAPKPIVIRTEDGLGEHIDVPAFPLVTEYGQVMDALRSLYRGPHTYRTVIVDTLDWLEPLIWAQVCTDTGVDNIEQVEKGFGKGYVFADQYWRKVLDGLNALRAKGMTVILIAHSEIKRFDAPDTEPYDRYQIKLHKRAAAIVEEWADIVGFAHFRIDIKKTDVGFKKMIARGVSTGDRLLSVEERPAFTAKNRYRLPADMPLDWPTLVDALRPSFRPPSPNGNAVPVAPATPEPTPESTPSTTQPTEELVNA